MEDDDTKVSYRAFGWANELEWHIFNVLRREGGEAFLQYLAVTAHMIPPGPASRRVKQRAGEEVTNWLHRGKVSLVREAVRNLERRLVETRTKVVLVEVNPA